MSPIRRALVRGCGGLALIAALTGAKVGLAEDVVVEASLERAITASADEMLQNLPRWMDAISGYVRGIARLDAVASRGKSEGLACVTDALTDGKELETRSKEAEAKLQEAIGRGDMERAGFEYRKLAVSVKKSRELFAAAERCALGEGEQLGRTRRDLEGAPTLSADDTVGLPNDILDYGFDPPDASPF